MGNRKALAGAGVMRLLMLGTVQIWNKREAMQLNLPSTSHVRGQQKACKNHIASPTLKKPRQLWRTQQTVSLVLLVTSDSGWTAQLHGLVHAAMRVSANKQVKFGATRTREISCVCPFSILFGLALGIAVELPCSHRAAAAPTGVTHRPHCRPRLTNSTAYLPRDRCLGLAWLWQ